MSAANKKMHTWEIALCIGLVLAITAGALAAGSDNGLSDKLIRLHVVGASDSESDQAFKLQVRDKTLELLAEPLANVTDTREAERVIAGNIPSLEEGLRAFIKEQGVNQSVSVSLREEAFPTREYGTFALPAGPYTALRVILDEGEGQNWWCVVFPPLCAASSMERMSDSSKAAGLSESDIALITQADDSYVVRFKLAEWLGNLKNMFLRR